MPTDTKTAILNSAEHAARTKGFDGFSYADLAEEVGLRKASIHHHFPTKAALSLAVMHRYSEKLATTRNSIDAEHPTGSGRLSAFIDLYRNALDGGNRLCLCVSYSISRESLPEEVIVQLAQFRRDTIKWLAATFALAKSDGTVAHVIDPTREAAATLSLLEGAQIATRTAGEPALFEVATQLCRERLQALHSR